MSLTFQRVVDFVFTFKSKHPTAYEILEMLLAVIMGIILLKVALGILR